MPATSTRRRAPTRKKRRQTARKPAGKSAPASAPRRSRSERSQPSAITRGRGAASRQLDGHRADVAAVALVVLGVLLTLGLTSDLAGPIGDGLADATGALFGRGRVAVPVACLGFALLLLWP